MNTKNISYILSTISVFAFMYYYFSLVMIWHCLAPFDLDMTSIITWDDIQFIFCFFFNTVTHFFFYCVWWNITNCCPSA